MTSWDYDFEKPFAGQIVELRNSSGAKKSHKRRDPSIFSFSSFPNPSENRSELHHASEIGAPRERERERYRKTGFIPPLLPDNSFFFHSAPMHAAACVGTRPKRRRFIWRYALTPTRDYYHREAAAAVVITNAAGRPFCGYAAFYRVLFPLCNAFFFFL